MVHKNLSFYDLSYNEQQNLIGFFSLLIKLDKKNKANKKNELKENEVLDDQGNIIIL